MASAIVEQQAWKEAQHRANFDEWLTKHQSCNSRLLSRDKLDEVRAFLRYPDQWKGEKNRSLRRRVRQSGYELFTFPNGEIVVCVRSEANLRRSEQLQSDQIAFSQLRRVACNEEVFDVIHKVHYIRYNHTGYRNVFEEIQAEYSNIPRAAVEAFTQFCLVCAEKRVQNVVEPLQPIISTSFLERLQIDLIDFRGQPDGTFKFVGHVIDHFSKFHVLFPLISKTAEEVAGNLVTRVFAYFGLPHILHSDNGREFVNKVIERIVEEWPGRCALINGRPRHPQSQGCVEKANHSVEDQISALRISTGRNNWASWLPRIQYTLNSRKCRTTGKTPFEVVFGQRPNNLEKVLFPSGRSTVMEEDVAAFLGGSPIQPACPDLADDERTMIDGATPQKSSSCGGRQERPSVICFGEKSTCDLTTASDDDVDFEREVVSVDQELGPKESITTLSPVRKRLRLAAYKSTLKHAVLMQKQYGKGRKDVMYFSLGQSVSVLIPKADRAKGDSRRIPGVVVREAGVKRKRYQIACKFGTLRGMFTASQLVPYPGVPPIDGSGKEISLREAARLNSSHKMHIIICKCKSGCVNKNCRCKAQRSECSTRCHAGRACLNSVSGLTVCIHENYPSYGGLFRANGMEVRFRNTCPVDCWLAILKALHLAKPALVDQMVKSLSARLPLMAGTITDIKGGCYVEAKYKLAQLNGLLIDKNNTFDFFGDENSRILKFLHPVVQYTERSICSSTFCPAKEIYRSCDVPLSIPMHVKSVAEFVSSVGDWLYKTQYTLCLRDLNAMPTSCDDLALLQKKEEGTDKPSCHGVRSTTKCDFQLQLPPVLLVSVEELENVNFIPDEIDVGNHSRYVRAGTSFHRAPCHFVACIKVGGKLLFYDGMEREPHVEAMSDGKLSGLKAQTCLYYLEESL